MTEIPGLDPERVFLIEQYGASIEALSPIGAQVSGIDFTTQHFIPAPLVTALEQEMAGRGFLVFRNEKQLEVEDFVRASCLWGGKALNSTHGVHPATPGNNRDIFRLSNDRRHGIPDVGPQWHNDGSFLPETFSHSGYHIIRPAEHGGGTWFAHQAGAYDALPDELKEYWSRLTSVNSNSGVAHPLVHTHPISGRKCVWLHLGMTGGVIEKLAEQDGFRLLNAQELRRLCHQYNDILNAGLENGYASAFEYEANDCVFIDNLAVAHRAAPQAHKPAEEQGLRILHRTTVRGLYPLAPGFGLPQVFDIHATRPTGDGVWQGGGLGFRWDDNIAMQN